jgi:hypothetical protein
VRDGQAQSAPVVVTLRVGPPRDTTAPFVMLEGGARREISRLDGVRGSAADVYTVAGRGGVPSSGLRGVVLRLQRSDGQYFNGRAYQGAPFDLPAALIGRTFFAPAGSLPSTSLAPSGRYLLTAIARDNAGNGARWL